MNTRLAATLRTDEAAVKTGDRLAMSEANKRFHMAIADAGRNPFLT